MKRQEKNKLQALNKEELISRLKKQRQEAMKIKLQKEAGKIKDVHTYMKKRKEIATILNTEIVEVKRIIDFVKENFKKHLI